MNSESFAGLIALRQRLDAAGSIHVFHEDGYGWVAGFEWKQGATRELLQQAEQSLHARLPVTYQRFLMETNGALLYHDRQYGQWGYLIYGTDELIEKRKYWSEIFKWDWHESYLVFAESLGDADVLVLDLAHPTSDGMDCVVRDGESGRRPSDWLPIANGFERWLDRLIVAQGVKYWRWCLRS